MLPKSISASLDCMVADKVLRVPLGWDMTRSYIQYKKGEIEFLNAMTPQERRQFLISKY